MESGAAHRPLQQWVVRSQRSSYKVQRKQRGLTVTGGPARSGDTSFIQTHISLAFALEKVLIQPSGVPG